MIEIIEKVKSKRNIKDLYEWQKEFFEFVEDKFDKNVIVNAPTGAGKTLIGEVYIYDSLLKGKKAVYIAPLRSLAVEKYNEWKKVFGWNIQLSAGDFNIVSDKNRDVDVYIFTFEKFLLKVVKDYDFLNDIGVVIVDEIHSLIEDERGAILEFLLTLIKDKVRILGLSATVKNLRELGKWLGAEVFSSIKTIVDVDVRVLFNGRIYDSGLNVIGEYSDWKDLIVDLILQGKKVLVFVSRRKDTKKYAEILNNMISVRVSSEERFEDDDLIKVFGAKIKFGVGYHNGAMSSKARKDVEDAFREGRLKCIVATKTLAMGVNLPADVVFIKDLIYFNGSEMKFMKVLDVWQMIGRAGRFSKKGEAYLYAGKKKGMFSYIVSKYLVKNYEDIKSSIIWNRHFELMILYAISYLGKFATFEEIVNLFAGSFFATYFLQALEVLENRVRDALENLMFYEFIDSEWEGSSEVYVLNKLGELCVKFAVDTNTVINFIDNRTKIEKEFDDDKLIFWLILNGVFGYLSGRGCMDDYIDLLEKFIDVFACFENIDMSDNALIKYFKTYCVLKDWIEGGEGNELLLLDIDSALRYISFFKMYVGKKENYIYDKLDNLYYRLKYGVPSDLVKYVRQKGIGRKKAFEMANKRMLEMR